MNTKFAAALALALTVGTAGLTGCSSSRSSVTVQESVKFSKGQELNDLQRAFKEGAITEREYESLRATIMKRPN